MTKPTSRRARTHDWIALRRQVAQEVSTPSLRSASEDYVDALEHSIHQREHAFLLAMLDNGVHVPSVLLPVLADAFRATSQGSQGRPVEFVSADVPVLGAGLELLMKVKGLTQEAALQVLADVSGRSVDTIKRALGKKK